MRVKLDENLPVALANVLTAIGHDVDTVEQEHLTGRSDEAVWQATQAAERFLVERFQSTGIGANGAPSLHIRFGLVSPAGYNGLGVDFTEPLLDARDQFVF